MAINFEQYAQKGNQFLNELAAELGNSSKEQAGRLTRAVFRTLRDVLTINESFQLISQLPMALKSVYVDGWDINIRKALRTEKDFLNNVAGEEGPTAWEDFSDMNDIRRAVVATFRVMRNYVSEGEFNDIESELPAQLKKMVEDSKGQGE